MQLKIVSRSGKELLPGGIDLPDATADVENLVSLIMVLSKEKKIKGIKAYLIPERQRLTIPGAAGAKPTVLVRGKTLAELGVKSGAAITLKDLGLQVQYRTVFFWEYFGPLVIFPLFLICREQVYGKAFVPQLAQQWATYYWCFHYFKRIAETFLVHSFSHATMPVFNLFRNCSYYWGFAAAVSYFVNHPDFTSPDELRVRVAFACAMLCQLANLKTHITLANLRKPGDKGYKIPRGFGFNWITCANYTFEIYGWFFFNVATQSLMGILFMMAGGLQMMQWAAQKHKRLRTQFDGQGGREKYPRRWKVLPFIF